MIIVCLSLALVALAISMPLTALMCRIGRRLEAFDSPGVPGQVKPPSRKVPNTGGIAIFLAIAVPIAVGLAALNLLPRDTIARLVPELAEQLPGIAQRTPMAFTLLAGLLVLHVVGLIDDRRPMGPWIKLILMVGVATVMVSASDSRLLTMLDPYVGGPWLSVVVTVLWLVVVTNAMNFLDNMDGLSAGVGAISASCFLAGALVTPSPQWFVCACLALLIGALTGFLVFNFPPAKIFMGDSGSLVVGFLLAFLTVRTTFYDTNDPRPLSGNWYALLMPLVILAVPLYDFVSVIAIRLSQGRNPLVGDMQHVSHRMVERGLSPPAAVLVIWGLTAVTGIGGIALASLKPWQAALVGVQTVMSLVVLAAFERASMSGRAR